MSKVALRKAWFQVHKWIGLVLAAVIIPISLTGAVLVWHDPLDRMMHPERYAVTGPGALPLGTYAASAQAALGDGELLSRVQRPEEAGEPVTVTATKPGKGRPQRLTLYLDPATAKVLGQSRSGEGIFQVMHVLHGSLMIPEVGRQVVGWIGVAMLIMSISGLWLWWPLVGSLRRGLRWKRHRNFDTNLHHQFGFWISVPLFVLSATGVWISFPKQFAAFETAVPAQGSGGGGGRSRPMPVAMDLAAIAPAVASAERAAGGQASAIGWPTTEKAAWSITAQVANAPEVDVTVPTDGEAISVEPGRGAQPETVARLMRRIHDGNDMPLVWQILVFLGGILPAVLAVTGIIMWWRARGWRRELGQRRAAAAASAG